MVLQMYCSEEEAQRREKRRHEEKEKKEEYDAIRRQLEHETEKTLLMKPDAIKSNRITWWLWIWFDTLWHYNLSMECQSFRILDKNSQQTQTCFCCWRYTWKSLWCVHQNINKCHTTRSQWQSKWIPYWWLCIHLLSSIKWEKFLSNKIPNWLHKQNICIHCSSRFIKRFVQLWQWRWYFSL